jgi:hypothetical protein
VDAVCQKRRTLLGPSAEPVPAGGVPEGKVLVFSLDENVGCGACQSATELELFDDVNLPGWDTWFALQRHGFRGDCLLCWIPERYVADVERGMRVEPTGCMSWWDDGAPPQTELCSDRFC